MLPIFSDFVMPACCATDTPLAPTATHTAANKAAVAAPDTFTRPSPARVPRAMGVFRQAGLDVVP